MRKPVTNLRDDLKIDLTRHQDGSDSTVVGKHAYLVLRESDRYRFFDKFREALSGACERGERAESAERLAAFWRTRACSSAG